MSTIYLDWWGAAAGGPLPPAYVTSWAQSTPTNPIYTESINFPYAGRYLISQFVTGPTNSNYVALTVNGVPASLVVRNTTVNSALLVAFFEIVIATPGTYDVSMEWATGSNMVRAAGGLHFVGSKVVVNTVETATAPDDLSMTTNADDVFLGIAVSDSGTGTTWAATGFTKNFELITDISRVFAGGSNLACTGNAPESFIFTPTGNTGNVPAVGVLCR